MLPLLSLFGALASLALMVCAVVGGVIPVLRSEKPDSSGRQAWVDLWIPILIALPLVVAAINLDAGSAQHATGAWMVITLPVASSMLGLAVCMGVQSRTTDNRSSSPAAPDLERMHGTALVAVAMLLLFVAIVGRLNDWHGNFLLAAAVAWMWMMSAEPRPERTIDEAGSIQKPIFVVDWADRTKKSLHPLAVVAIIAGTLGVIFGSRYTSSEAGTVLSYAAALTPLPMIVGVGFGLGSESARRTTASTIVLGVLLPLGVFALRLLPWKSIRHWADPNMDFMAGSLQITGLSVLLPCAIAVASLAGLALSPKPWSRRGWTAVFAVAVILIALVGFNFLRRDMV